MRSAPFFSAGKTCTAAVVVLLMVTFLALYRCYLYPGGIPVLGAVAPDAVGEVQPLEVQRSLAEQKQLLDDISENVDNANQSLDEITVLLQAHDSR